MVVTNQLGAMLHSKRAREAEKNRSEERMMRMIADAIGGVGDQIAQSQMLKQQYEREDRLLEGQKRERTADRLMKLNQDRMMLYTAERIAAAKQHAEVKARLDELRGDVAR